VDSAVLVTEDAVIAQLVVFLLSFKHKLFV
jgi:hypothetical protein